MKKTTIYLDRRHNKAPPETAKWKVTRVNGDDDELIKESWEDLEYSRVQTPPIT